MTYDFRAVCRAMGVNPDPYEDKEESEILTPLELLEKETAREAVRNAAAVKALDNYIKKISRKKENWPYHGMSKL